MLQRKIEPVIEQHLKSKSRSILLIDGARQVGKTYIVRYVGNKLFENFIEINLLEDKLDKQLFAHVKNVNDFYLTLSSVAGTKMKNKDNTLIFIDEIQAYPHFLTLLKFLADDAKFSYIGSGSLLGVTLAQTSSIPMGSIKKIRMYPLDFEEFMLANGVGKLMIDSMKNSYMSRESLGESQHNMAMDLFRKYLLVGGLPDAVKEFLKTKNIEEVRYIQEQTHEYYSIDASKYDMENKLKIQTIYELIPSCMENKKKRMIAKEIENKKGATFKTYREEFDYLVGAGIALEVSAISNPHFPLIESSSKNLLKLYLSDVGMLTNILYKTNIRPMLDDVRSVNLGAVYESVVASELNAHGHTLFYYDNRSKGEVDFLIDDYDNLSVLPIEVKSGRDYSIHSALNNLTKTDAYGIKEAFVLSNERIVKSRGKITYLPIYYVMFL